MNIAYMDTRPSFPLMKQTDVVSFYHLQMPRWLFAHEKYKSLSLESKVECNPLLPEPWVAEDLPALDPQDNCAEQGEIPEPKPKLKQEKSPTKKSKQEKPKRTAAAKKAEDKPADKPVSARQAFYQLDFRELGRNLSPEQEQEWNSIYASYRSGSILTGTVSGVNENILT